MKRANIYRTAALAVVCAAALAFCWKPDWVRKLPQARAGAAYYYRTANATGLNVETARTKALNEIMEKSAYAMGTPQRIQRDSVTGELVVSHRKIVSHIPVNVVCEYVEPLIERNGVRVYLLCQVSNDVSIPKYNVFDCGNSRETED